MRYITQNDLTTDSYQRFITESSSDITDTLDKAEARAIALAASYMTRYDTESIFGELLEPEDEDNPAEYAPGIRHELLVEIICRITLYKIFRRNAARKVPEDTQKDYDWAIKELEQIRNGAVKLPGLPPAIDESGKPLSTSIWGNTSNPDYYI